MKKIIGIFVLGLGFVSHADAANSTTPGALIVTATFECISVRAKFTGDDNATSSATIKFKKSSDPTFLYAYPPILDRRANLTGTSGHSSNPFVNEARGSIVGLLPNTSYEVQVTWNDPDGVGTQPATVTIPTLSLNPPTGVTPKPATPSTLTSVLGGANPGDTIQLAAGNYSAFTIARSGSPSNYITVTGPLPGQGVATVSGTGVHQNILVNPDVSYVIIKNLTLGPSDHDGIQLSDRSNHIFIQNNIIQDVSRACTTDFCSSCNTQYPNTYNDAGVEALPGTNNIFILSNLIQGTTLNNPACTQGRDLYENPGSGVYKNDSGGTFVIADSTFTGGFRDAIGGAGSGNAVDNYDIARNTFRGYKDDAIEMDGDDMNTRIWGNTITVDVGNDAISNAPVVVGPNYVFRNTIKVAPSTPLGSGQGVKLSGSSQSVAYNFFFHNSIDTSQNRNGNGDSLALMDGSPAVSHHTLLNNIMKTSGNSIYRLGPDCKLDYNLYSDATGPLISDWWNGSSYVTYYAPLTTFYNATGQEQHGLSQDPLFTDATLQINTNSPAVNKGVVIPNFNDAAAAPAWQYTGTAPDIGAFETGGTTPPVDTSSPTVPSGLAAIAASSSQIDLYWTASTDSGGSGLAGYKIFRGAAQVGTSGTNSYSDSSGLIASTAYTYRVSAYDSAGNTSAQSISASTTTLPAGSTGSTPYSGTPAPIPGTIEAENYDLGGEGVAYHDMDSTNNQGAFRLSEGVDVKNSSDLNGGYAIGWIEAGEWQNYSVNVTQAGSYTFSARVAAIAAGGSFHVDIDGVNKTGTITVPVTATAWNTTWGTVTTPAISLSTGPHVMHVVADTIEFDLNNFTWTLGSGTPHPADTSTQDWKITLNEATQYGSCWKSAPAIPTGCPTPAASLDNSVRAGTIWNSTSNGSYHYDSTKTCPLCWVAP